ncbi:unnamed protein product [Candida verbasci]|uniref:Peptidase M48 domain-containing protein n=1 Tax=Candida verbasci TaxID=1227364 RepID=A0A9W4TX86_9ASCO|nr:unnamed protein product [Candida verbasci]
MFRHFTRTYATYKRFNNTTKSVNYYNLLHSRKTLYVGGGLIGFYIYNLHEAPYTHRRRFIWVPFWLGEKIGDYTYKQIMYQYGSQILPHSNPLYSKVSNVMNKLLQVSLNSEETHQKQFLKNLNWEINIINNDSLPPNAFILPNGKIFIFSSILRICQNDDGLATVLSHELSHQLAQHSNEQLSSQPIYMALSTILYTLTGVSWFNDLLINGVLTMPASREMESEADHIGCEILARACFDPKQSIYFWQRMNQAEKRLGGEANARLEWFSSHPATSRRIADIESWMPKLEQIKADSNCHSFYQFDEFHRNFFKRT